MDYGIGHIAIIPPLSGSCPVCAIKHDSAMPHHRDSLYYQMRFYQKFGRFATWADAMAHCDDHIKAVCTGLIAEKNVSVTGLAGLRTCPEVTGNGL